MYKYPIELQDEEKACGAYCIAMILKYYHFHDEIKNIKNKQITKIETPTLRTTPPLIYEYTATKGKDNKHSKAITP